MLNELHALLHRPEKGWDPVKEAYAREYAGFVWSQRGEIDEEMARIEARLGPLRGMRILDLGGGPGQYSCEFARRGAQVTWHDVSANYMRLVKTRAESEGLRLEYSLGYMEEADRVLTKSFDFVYSRVCWSYCRNDSAFSRVYFKLVRPGGTGRVVFCTPNYEKRRTLARDFLYAMYENFGVKIGHLHAPAEMMVKWFTKLSPRTLELDMSDPSIAVMTFTK